MFPFALTVGLSPNQRETLVEGLTSLDEHPAVAHLYVSDEPGAVRSVVFVRGASREAAQIVIEELVATLEAFVPPCLGIQIDPITSALTRK